MKWQFIAGNPKARPLPDGADDEWMGRIEIDEMVGDLGMTYVNDIAVWYADGNIRTGYEIKVEGSCFKGPYAIKWSRIRILFEDEGAPDGLVEHLTALWGRPGEHLAEGDEPRLDRIE